MTTLDSELVWLNGDLVRRVDAKVNLLSPTSQFGANVFEGIRCYLGYDSQNLYGFRLEEHSDRLCRSIKLLGIDLEWKHETMIRALKDIIHANHYSEDIAARVIVFVDGYGSWFSEGPAGVFVAGVAKGRHLSKGVPGISCCISSWRRIDDNTMSPRIKAGANYINSRMAQLEAKRNGYDSAIFLNNHGKVAEGPGSCLFIVKANKLITPPLSASVLESITRETVIEFAKKDLNLIVEERDVDRTELYMADEAFICGSAVEVVPIVRIDRFTISNGTPGPITSGIFDKYLDCVRGGLANYKHWVTPLK